MNRNFVWMLVAVAQVSAAPAGVNDCPDIASAAPDPVLFEQFRKLESDRIQAGVRKDVAFIEAATADEYVQIDWTGKTLDKKAMLARIGGSDIKLQSNTVDQFDVKVYGNIAVVMVTATRKGVMDGKDISGTIRGTKIYVKRNARWQVVQFQQTLLVPKPG